MGFLSDVIGAGCDLVADATSPFREVANNMVVEPAKQELTDAQKELVKQLRRLFR